MRKSSERTSEIRKSKTNDWINCSCCDRRATFKVAKYEGAALATHPAALSGSHNWGSRGFAGGYLLETPGDITHLDPKHPHRIVYCTQTTLSIDDTKAVIDALRATFPAILGLRHDDICYAKQNRQDAVRTLGPNANRCSSSARRTTPTAWANWGRNRASLRI
jgi:hypothetical protein